MQIIFFTILFIFFSFGSSISSNFMDKGFYVIDLKNRIEWLKCTTGQQWSDEKQDCLGEPVKLDFEEITLALANVSVTRSQLKTCNLKLSKILHDD